MKIFLTLTVLGSTLLTLVAIDTNQPTFQNTSTTGEVIIEAVDDPDYVYTTSIQLVHEHTPESSVITVSEEVLDPDYTYTLPTNHTLLDNL